MTEETRTILEAIGKLDLRMGNMEHRLDDVKNDIKNVHLELDDVKNDIADIKDDVKNVKLELKDDIADVRMIIENDITKKINIVGEGHLDLYRKLDQATAIEHEKEMLKIRMISLEGDMRWVKKRVEALG